MAGSNESFFTSERRVSIESFGESELDQIAINHPEVVDLDKLAQYVVDTDGIANTLASYDGKEIELYEGGYAYRVN